MHVKSNLRRTVCIDLKAKKNIKPSRVRDRRQVHLGPRRLYLGHTRKGHLGNKKQDKRTLDKLSALWHTRKTHLDIQDKIYDIQVKQTLDNYMQDKAHIGHKIAHFGQANLRHIRQNHWFYNVAIQKQTNNISITILFNGR